MLSNNSLAPDLISILEAEHSIYSTRRELLITPFLAAVTLTMFDASARAGQINPAETAITLPDAIRWNNWISGFPPQSGEMATLYGCLDKSGPYLVLMKWYPGYISAPHSYVTDRLSLVLSGTWWGNSGADFDPNNTVPVPGRWLRQARCRYPTL